MVGMAAPTRTDTRVPVYDADAHICEPTAVWEEYCDPEYRDRVIRAGRTTEGDDVLFVNG